MQELIKQKFEVLGKYFDTVEDAEAYLTANKDQARVDAFIQYMRDNGAKRIPTNVPEAILNFIKFENGTLKQADSHEVEDANVPEPEPEVVADTSDLNPSPGIFDKPMTTEELAVEASEPEDVTTADEPEESVEETGRKSLFGA
jgi:hypothetical protein